MLSVLFIQYTLNYFENNYFVFHIFIHGIIVRGRHNKIICRPNISGQLFTPKWHYTADTEHTTASFCRDVCLCHVIQWKHPSCRPCEAIYISILGSHPLMQATQWICASCRFAVQSIPNNSGANHNQPSPMPDGSMDRHTSHRHCSLIKQPARMNHWSGY